MTDTDNMTEPTKRKTSPRLALHEQIERDRLRIEEKAQRMRNRFLERVEKIAEGLQGLERDAEAAGEDDVSEACEKARDSLQRVRASGPKAIESNP